MDYSSIPLIQLMQQKMHYLSARQGALALNIAGADLPGYKAQDLVQPDFESMLSSGATGKVSLARTNPMHFGAGAAKGGDPKSFNREVTYETNFNENAVSLDEEVKKAAETQLEYQQIVAVYRKTNEMFKAALGRQG